METMLRYLMSFMVSNQYYFYSKEYVIAFLSLNRMSLHRHRDNCVLLNC